MKRRPQFVLAGALVLAALVLAGLEQRSRPAAACGDRGSCCPLLSLPAGLRPTAGTNGSVTNTGTLTQTNQF